MKKKKFNFRIQIHRKDIQCWEVCEVEAVSVKQAFFLAEKLNPTWVAVKVVGMEEL